MNPVALLEAQEQEVQEKISEILEAAGIRHKAHPEGILVYDDSTTEETAATIRLWQHGRRPQAAAEAGNPFSDVKVRSWVGASPTMDPSVVESTVEHFVTGGFLTLGELLGENAFIETTHERDSSRKSHHIARLRAFCEDGDVAGYTIDALEMMLDELYTNAVYNAPVDSAGEPFNAHKSRSEKVMSDRPFTIRFGRDDSHVAVSVRDNYGSLPVEQVVSSLARCFEPEGAVPRENGGGAGLGFFMLLMNASRLVVNVNPGQFTEVVVIRRISERRRQFRQSSPTLNLCAPSPSGRIGMRRAERVPVVWPAHLCAGETQCPAVVLDVSVGGAFLYPVKGEIPVVAGETVEVTLYNKMDRKPVQIRAVVRWLGHSVQHRRDGIGVEFDQRVTLATYG
ncbi:PilZ domain-containing protein [Myxococcota bacterium]